MERQLFHSVTLDEEKCKGCINCMKRCPTEAIRVRGGKSYIISARCIDCGECIRICQHRARKVNADEFDVLDGYRWKIALPAPSFYGQFEGVKDINPILTALKLIGFDDVFEVSRAAELVSDLTRRAIKDLRSKVDGPVISSACPAVVRLIRVRYPQLCDHVLPLNEPMVIASRIARAEAAKKTGLKPEEIGTFFITPCPAKVTAAKAPLGIDDTGVSGVLPASKVYTKVLSVLRKAIEQPENLSNSGRIGVSWAMGGGETAALNSKNTLRAHSIENVIKVLDELENEKMQHLDFVELGACPCGCVGGVLHVANPFAAEANLKELRNYLPREGEPKEERPSDAEFFLDKTLVFEPVYQLAENRVQAMEKQRAIYALQNRLPGLDCGICGAPSCRAFAEDVINGHAREEDCIIRISEELQKLPLSKEELHHLIPLPFRHQTPEE